MSIPKHVRCFFCEPTERERRYLRRYVETSVSDCPGSYHNAQTYIGDGPISETSPPPIRAGREDYPHDDERWPAKCQHCDYRFTESDHWQLFTARIYLRSDTGAELTLWDKIPGMMWDASWYSQKGPDGRSLMVVCPDGWEWFIDGPASNCRNPEDRDNHNCWGRTGEVPAITVARGPCKTGGGSIQTNHGYHGFLRNGAFDP